MNLRRLSWIALASLACGGAALSYVRLSDKLSVEVTSLKRELSEVKRGRDGGPSVIREVHVASPAEDPARDDDAVPDASAGSAAPALPELTDEAREAEDAKRKRYAEARMALLQIEHANEPEDPEWSRGAAATLADAYSTPEFQSLRVTTVCKYTLCRVDVSYTDAEQGPEAIRRFTSTSPWDGRRSSKIDLEKREGSSYFAREGFELPVLDPKTLEN